jgi:hypothetical protein
MFGGGRGSNAPMSGGIKSPKALSNKQLSRVNQSYARFISKDANLGDKFRLAKRGYIKPGQIFSKGGPEALASGGGKVAKAFGKFGASIIPGIGAVVGAADATLRAQSGDTTGAAIAGAVLDWTHLLQHLLLQELDYLLQDLHQLLPLD